MLASRVQWVRMIADEKATTTRRTPSLLLPHRRRRRRRLPREYIERRLAGRVRPPLDTLDRPSVLQDPPLLEREEPPSRSSRSSHRMLVS